MFIHAAPQSGRERFCLSLHRQTNWPDPGSLRHACRFATGCPSCASGLSCAGALLTAESLRERLHEGGNLTDSVNVAHRFVCRDCANRRVGKKPGFCGEAGLLKEARRELMTENRAGALLVRALCCWCLVVTVVGCSRTRYRLAADRDATAILAEKSACQPWQLPAMFSVYPDPRSRFFDPTPTDDPALPVPAPQLYAYTLPELPQRRARAGSAAMRRRRSRPPRTLRT